MASIESSSSSTPKQYDTPLGIAPAVFIDDIAKHLKAVGGTAESEIEKMNQTYSKYKFMETRLTSQLRVYQNKLPELKQTIIAVKTLLKSREEEQALHTRFSLGPDVYAHAEVENPSHVCLWLGANVMVEYTLEEALETLEGNERELEKKVKVINEGLDYLRDQATCTEVTMARFYNHDVKLRRNKLT